MAAAAVGPEAAACPEAAAGAEPPVPPANQEGLDAAPASGIAEPQREELQCEELHLEERASSNTRHLSAALRRSVWERDGGRCTYVDPRGVRCRETGGLEFHHRRAFALGGVTSVDNIELHCRPHNALRAEQDFGRAHMQRKGRSSAEMASPPERDEDGAARHPPK
jgi:hypothetical protein